MFGKNRIVNKHGLKMVGLKKASGATKRNRQGIIFWDRDTGNVVEEAKYKEYLNSLYGMIADIKYLYWKLGALIIRYDGPMTMQEIADAIYEEYREEMAWRETAEENGWRVKE